MKIEGETDRDVGNLRITGHQRTVGDAFEGSSENQGNNPGNNPCPPNGRLNTESADAFELESAGESRVLQNQANPLVIQSSFPMEPSNSPSTEETASSPALESNLSYSEEEEQRRKRLLSILGRALKIVTDDQSEKEHKA